MNRLQRSWQLLQSSLAVMQRDKRLLLFPILTFFFTIVVAVLFLMPVAFQPTGHHINTFAHWQAVGNSVYATSQPEAGNTTPTDGAPDWKNRRANVGGLRPLAVGYFAAMYFVSMFIATFFNVAFYKEILNALNGQPVSISDGVRFAFTKWRAILMWTLFAGAVGYIIKALEQRFGLIGQIIIRLLGTAWSIACVFVIPVIITDEEAVNPIAVLKQSALTLKRTWGESLAGYVGISLGGGLVTLASILPVAIGIAISVQLHWYWLIPVVVSLWFLTMLAWSYLLSVASQIFRCALYLYATQGTLPPPYTQEMAAMAWKYRKS